MSVDVMMGKAFLEYEAYRACVTREGLTCGAMLDSIAEMQCNTLCARHGRGVPELLSHEHGSALFPVSACALTHDLMLPYTSAAGGGTRLVGAVALSAAHFRFHASLYC